MANDSVDNLLSDGWEIAGYSTTITVAGTLMHSVLFRKGTWLRTVTVGVERGSEVARVVSNL